ncbi:G-type lectin S-receptor-like serine/threonine-protein kinase [Carex littledalei]|uniref:Receptor-like serine/threonine-protein kinase n=1 Tax=Carex littledalei TaxID=544730 RepID=A0A833V282_9POAL|nr:G-type lectin S-receptor-like serine/threonine-protein kinase [Carex littledalei]
MPSTFLYLLLFFSFYFHGIAAIGAEIEYIYPNFSASNLFYFSTDGVFLTSRSGTFQAALYKPGTQQYSYYLSVLHSPTQMVVWTANRNIPMDRTSTVELTTEGLYANYPNGSSKLWSTPPLKAPVKSLRLLENGNLVILDAMNASLWQSFDHPSDALLSGQLLSVGAYLASSTSDTDYTESDYRLDVGPTDAILKWLGIPYWRLSNDMNSVKDRDATVAYLTINDSGVSLATSSGAVVYQITLDAAPLRILKLGSDGRLRITSFETANSSVAQSNAFVAPSSNCDLPLSCGSLGLCSAQGNSSSCFCPPNFASSTHASGCSPVNGKVITANNSCNTKDDPDASYLYLGSGIAYFGNKFRNAATVGKNRSTCETLCTSNCSCSGYFYDTSSRSCFLLQQPIGSLISTNSSESGLNSGYVKIVNSDGGMNKPNSSSPKIVPILLPSIAAFLAMLTVCGFGFVWWRRSQKKILKSKSSITKSMIHGPLSRPVSDSDRLFSENDDDISEILLPGLPTRFSFEELEEVTSNFLTKIGSGGFGSVYKGELADRSLVAVKKIEGVGVQGRKEFCTEIAVIGNIHHVNLVRLRGYCAQGSHRLLVYEYMNRGSLDRSLFRPTGPLLEWADRMHVALGAARGLAYLHSGCQPKIIHCDVKPENILLDDEGKTTLVKIADFGLAKLLTAEQSGLFTTMRGTRGYLAPEWLSNTPISDRTDVYSFGMVLLEILRGRKNRSERVTDGNSNISSTSTEPVSTKSDYFPLIALEKYEQKLYVDLADPRLEGRVEVHELERMVKTALCCLHEDPGLRPSMTLVAAMLEGTMEAWEPRAEALGFLRVYGRGFVGNVMEIEDMTNRFGRSQATTATNSGWPSYMSSNELSGPR